MAMQPADDNLSWLGDVRDRARLMSAFRSMVTILLTDDRELETYVRGRVVSAWHPSGSYKMGDAADPLAVVDPKGRVIGVENLYVADASIFQEIPRANTNLTAIVLGERMTDLIKQG